MYKEKEGWKFTQFFSKGFVGVKLWLNISQLKEVEENISKKDYGKSNNEMIYFTFAPALVLWRFAERKNKKIKKVLAD